MDAILVEALSIGGAGPTVVVKDTIDIAGRPTRAGSRAFADAPPARRHAAVVQALLDGGARIVGKANLHELAFGVTGVNPWTGTPTNPNYPGLIPGGSSSGSAAAVAAGLADIGIGTDTGGSVRIPAACCGVFGLKPSFGRISRAGVLPAESSLDCVGALARDMATLERAMALIDASFRSVDSPAEATLGLVEVEADRDAGDAVAAALARTDVEVRIVRLPSFAKAYEAGITVIAAENWAAFGELAQSDRLGADVRRRLLAGREVTDEQLCEAEATRRRFAQEVDAALEGLDALALPTLPCPPPGLAADPLHAVRLTALVRPFNLSGHPALSIPLETPSGAPVGLQLVGRRGADEQLCAVARRLAEGGLEHD
jgi:amidase